MVEVEELNAEGGPEGKNKKPGLLSSGSSPLEQPSSRDSRGPYAGYFQMLAENMDVHPGLPSCQLLISFALLFIPALFVIVVC